MSAKPLAQNLRAAMLRKGLNGKRLSEISGVGAPVISRYRSGKRERPSATHIKRLAAALAMTSEELLGSTTVDPDAEPDDSKETRAAEGLPALRCAARRFPWPGPVSLTDEVMAIARAEAKTEHGRERDEGMWEMRLRELLAEHSEPRSARASPPIAAGSASARRR